MDPFAHLHLADTSALRAMQELLLLADHIQIPSERCYQCILKHALKADAYAREALTLTAPTFIHQELADFASGVLATVRTAMQLGDTEAIASIPDSVREYRLKG